MKNIWDEGFKEPTAEFPEKLLLEIITPFEDITNNLATLNLVQLDNISRIGSRLEPYEFQFGLYLVSRVLRGYSFEVLRFGYGVTLFPALIVLEKDIGKELQVRPDVMGEMKVNCSNQEEFIKVVTIALKSDKFRNTVGGLMKIAKLKN